MDEFAATAEGVARAFVAACEAELDAPKPGNVHVYAPGHGMESEDFIKSARAAAPFIAAPGASVGERILGAVEATWAAVDQNTNLGIVLLCGPLAQAALLAQSADLEAETAGVLAALTVEDATAAFRAIALARPAGLGSAPQHDVNAPVRTTLLEAMRAAADRDRIAFQYANDYLDIFHTGLGALNSARAKGGDAESATLAVYLAFLAAFPDSHVGRKYGFEAADNLRREADRFLAGLISSDRDIVFAAALTWDASLKKRALNPGTSADLTVATLFADSLAAILASARKNG